ncbi:GntR family transcriptional regulator [Ancylobacter defluvii]|uniref:GntR family transcriptional regulator n=1 Tax=Ancylobacter defluvii TaxID=1282440 RepID=A0A9W6NAQ0_9HYPH|nr:GntR family transcriptional regulator [Ancylobacter defluvii]MBS7588535.1 GntR family transcriptional regulator [Ancylobacter defluvii]GLK83815.1 GntR family transcriptional regulator [Ancylobacter defluvii]
MADTLNLRVDRTTKTLRQLSLEKMRDGILSFHFKPGERLVERNLVEILGVSRTVVREVIRHLESEGLVEIVPHHGPIVARAEPEKVAQIYELRAMLEAMAARDAALRATDADIAQLDGCLEAIHAGYDEANINKVLEATTRFYEVLFLAAGKSIAWDMLRALTARINHLRAITVSSKGRSVDGPQEMRRIVDAIRARDGEAAYSASRAHVERAATLALSYVSDADGPKK